MSNAGPKQSKGLIEVVKPLDLKIWLTLNCSVSFFWGLIKYLRWMYNAVLTVTGMSVNKEIELRSRLLKGSRKLFWTTAFALLLESQTPLHNLGRDSRGSEVNITVNMFNCVPWHKPRFFVSFKLSRVEGSRLEKMSHFSASHAPATQSKDCNHFHQMIVDGTRPTHSQTCSSTNICPLGHWMFTNSHNVVVNGGSFHLNLQRTSFDDIAAINAVSDDKVSAGRLL